MKRSLGNLLLDLENLLDELVDSHELQTGDILNLIHGHLQIHRPDAFEEYIDGTTPGFYYGPKEHK